MLLLMLLLAACTSSTAQEPAPQPPTATAPPPRVTQSAAPDSTIPPASTQPPAPTQPPALVGSEWTVAYEGDLNGDGARDVVAYKAADITPAPDMRSYLEEMPLVVAEAVIVQETAQGSTDTHVQASVSPQGVAAADTALLDAEQFGEPGPAAFLMGVDPQAQDAQVSFIRGRKNLRVKSDIKLKSG